jgi:Ca2+:H+ antiporter
MPRLLALVLLPPAVLVALRLLGVPEPVVFVVAIAGLVPIAWLIGRATEEAGKHSGPVVGGFLNATFGNAPELFLAFFALQESLFVAVRGSLTGSVPSNLLLMLGLTLLVARGGEPAARRSVVVTLVVAAAATAGLLVADIGHAVEDTEAALPAWEIPVCVALLVLYVVLTAADVRGRRHPAEPESAEWSLRLTIVLLALATASAGVLVEGLTASLVSFSDTVGLSLFVLSVTALALVSDTAEHSAAVFVSARGRLALGMEVVLRTVAQIVAFLLPVIALLSWLTGEPLPLDPRGVELAVMAGSVALAALVLGRGRPTRSRGGVLVAGYVAGVAAFVAFG